MPQFVALSLLFVFTLAVVCEAESLSWPDRSGPTFNGNVAANDAHNLPTEWDEDSGQNIAWKIALAGFGHSTPIIGHGKIWLTAATEDGKQQFIDCIDEATGNVIHHKLLFENNDPEPLNNPINTYASPSCLLEDSAVYVHFGTYGTARLNPETAEIIWQRRDINCLHFRGPGSSPVLFENLLILTFDGIDQQFLTALDKQTGETVWRTERSTDYGDLDADGKPLRDGDIRKAYSTPGLIDVNGHTHLVSAGSRAAFGYDARTGEELWTVTHDDFNAAARPFSFEGHVIINTGSRNANMLAVKLNETTRGNVDKTHVTWNRDSGNSRMSSPVLHNGLIYFVNDTGVITCVDAATGDEVWKDRARGNYISSPIAANDMIYFCNEEGETTVLQAGREFKVLQRNKLAEGMRSSPAAANGALFLRTFGHLYKIKNTK